MDPLDYSSLLDIIWKDMLCHDSDMHDAGHSAELLPEPLVEITKGSACSEHAQRKSCHWH